MINLMQNKKKLKKNRNENKIVIIYHIKYQPYLRRYQFHDGSIFMIIDINITLNSFFYTSFLGRFEDVRIVEMLQGFWGEIHAKLLQVVSLKAYSKKGDKNVPKRINPGTKYNEIDRF